MADIHELLYEKPASVLFEQCPVAADYIETMRMDDLDRTVPFAEALRKLPPELFVDFETDTAEVLAYLQSLIEAHASIEAAPEVRSLEILGGFDKTGQPEELSVRLLPGEVICVVGPTGSGKSRLLEDVEYLSQGDSPTGRRILLNGEPVSDGVRFRAGSRVIAQLTQTMNFVMDLSVEEFLKMHARCLTSAVDADDRIRATFEKANELAGEAFPKDIKVTQLSGGQSRALMIADTACMSAAPVVLIDEIENAGIDRQKALALLTSREKIVLMATHDPLLMLGADRRIAMANGGMRAVLATSDPEKAILKELTAADERLSRLRETLRTGGQASFNPFDFPAKA